MNKINLVIFLVIFIAGCDNKKEIKETTQNKKDTLACPAQPDLAGRKDIRIDTSNSTQPRQGGTIPQKQEVVSRDSGTTKQLPTVLFITTSEGCHCALVRCSEGDSIIKKIVKPFFLKLELKQIDYAKEKDSVEKLAKKYQIYGLPALIVFDGEGNFKCKFDSPFEEGLIQEKLKEIGVK